MPTERSAIRLETAKDFGRIKLASRDGRAFPREAQRQEGSSALVRMPTGTGKSGVIAVALSGTCSLGGCLVVDTVGHPRPATHGRRQDRLLEPIQVTFHPVRTWSESYPSTAAGELARHRIRPFGWRQSRHSRRFTHQERESMVTSVGAFA